jgi:hypothetical protein
MDVDRVNLPLMYAPVVLCWRLTWYETGTFGPMD